MSQLVTEASNIGEFLSLDPCELFKTTDELTTLKTLQKMRLASFGLGNDLNTLMIEELDTVLLYANNILDIASIVSNTRHRLGKIQSLSRSAVDLGVENSTTPKPEEQRVDSKARRTETPLGGGDSLGVSRVSLDFSRGVDGSQGLRPEPVRGHEPVRSHEPVNGAEPASGGEPPERTPKPEEQGACKCGDPDTSTTLSDAVKELQSLSFKNYLLLKQHQLVESYKLLKRVSLVLDTATRLLGEVSVPRAHLEGFQRLLEHVPKMLKLQRARLAKVCKRCLTSEEPLQIAEAAIVTLLLNTQGGENEAEFEALKRLVYDQHVEKTNRAPQCIENGGNLTGGIDGRSLVGRYLGTSILHRLLGRLHSYQHLCSLVDGGKENLELFKGNAARTSAEEDESEILNLYIKTLTFKFEKIKLKQLKGVHLNILECVDLYSSELKGLESSILMLVGIDAKLMLQKQVPIFKGAITKVWNDCVERRTLKRLENIEASDLSLAEALEELLEVVDILDGNETLANVAWPRMEHILIKQALFISSALENVNLGNEQGVTMVTLATLVSSVLESTQLDKALVTLDKFPPQLQEHSSRCIFDICYYTLKHLCLGDVEGYSIGGVQGSKLRRPLLRLMIASKSLQLHLFKLSGFTRHRNIHKIKEATVTLLKEVIDSQIYSQAPKVLNGPLQQQQQQQQPPAQPLQVSTQAPSEAPTEPLDQKQSANSTEAPPEAEDSMAKSNFDPTCQTHVDACNLDGPTLSSPQAQPDSLQGTLLAETDVAVSHVATTDPGDALHVPHLPPSETPQEAQEIATETAIHSQHDKYQPGTSNTSHTRQDAEELSLVLLALQDGVYGDSPDVEAIKQHILNLQIEPQESQIGNYQSFKALLI